MSEATRQAVIAAALIDIFQSGSILINDYRTPQTVSRDRAPWCIIALADEVTATPGASWSTPEVIYGVYVTLLDYRRGRTDKAFLDAFQELRQATFAALLSMSAGTVRRVESNTALGPYFTEEGEPDPDSLAQRFVINVIEYEV